MAATVLGVVSPRVSSFHASLHVPTISHVHRLVVQCAPICWAPARLLTFDQSTSTLASVLIDLVCKCRSVVQTFKYTFHREKRAYRIDSAQRNGSTNTMHVQPSAASLLTSSDAACMRVFIITCSRTHHRFFSGKQTHCCKEGPAAQLLNQTRAPCRALPRRKGTTGSVQIPLASAGHRSEQQ